MHLESLSQDTRFGKYEIHNRLGIGGVGTVYKALDVDLDRFVALKLLAPRFASRPPVIARFRSEARAAAKLKHENIVGVYEFGEIKGVHYLAMEFIDGMDLHELVRRKQRLQPAEARGYLAQAARALDHAHRQGLVHRDIKPSNFLVTQHEGKAVIKLTDFGLARMSDDTEFSLTGEGLTVGTADYIAPEQARNSRLADARSDLYSLGCTFFYMLAGRAPFAKGSAAERLLAHMNTEPPNVRQFNPAVSVELVQVLRRLLAKNPKERFQTPSELINELNKLDRTLGTGSGRLPSALPTVIGDAGGDSTTKLSLAAPPRTSTLTAAERGQLAAQFDQAMELSGEGKHKAALRLLHRCCKSEPGNLGFRQGLRRVAKVQHSLQKPGIIRAWLAVVVRKSKIQNAMRKRNFAKVLALGEEVLEWDPDEVEVVLSMSEAATAMELPEVAAWLLAAAVQQNRQQPDLLRALARLNERQGNLAQAITLWKLVAKKCPNDPEARQKLNDLTAKQAIFLGDYGSRIEDAE